jgi:hypothetical protein
LGLGNIKCRKLSSVSAIPAVIIRINDFRKGCGSSCMDTAFGNVRSEAMMGLREGANANQQAVSMWLSNTDDGERFSNCVGGGVETFQQLHYHHHHLFICVAGVEPSPLLLWSFIGLLYQPWMVDCDDCGAISGRNEWQRKLKNSEKTCPSANLSTTNPT